MDWEQKSLINELTRGREIVQQLMNHLDPASSSLETRQYLVDEILSSFEKSLSLLNWVQSNPAVTPRSEISDQDCKGDRPNKNIFKKRKTQQRRTEQVKVCSGTGLEGRPLDDGYSWRKYGQKDILGASFPRGYYRCTHRNSQGCLAVKQVQRSDVDPSIFEATYRGRHTCVHSAMSSAALVNQKPQEQQQPRNEDKSKAAGFFSVDGGEEIFPSFSFLDAIMEKDILVDSVSPTFISPATSESNYFSPSASLCQMDSFGIGSNYNVQTPESEPISISASVTNSPVGDLDISNFDFDSNFQFDGLELYVE